MIAARSTGRRETHGGGSLAALEQPTHPRRGAAELCTAADLPRRGGGNMLQLRPAEASVPRSPAAALAARRGCRANPRRAPVEQCSRAECRLRSGCCGPGACGRVLVGRPLRPSERRDHAAWACWRLWSFIRLWVAAISRHSERAADRPQRWNEAIRRLCLVCPNTGSTMTWRLR
jgi:hypothetical protein